MDTRGLNPWDVTVGVKRQHTNLAFSSISEFLKRIAEEFIPSQE
jgi:hypothetical protein